MSCDPLRYVEVSKFTGQGGVISSTHLKDNPLMKNLFNGSHTIVEAKKVTNRVDDSFGIVSLLDQIKNYQLTDGYNHNVFVIAAEGHNVAFFIYNHG